MRPLSLLQAAVLPVMKPVVLWPLLMFWLLVSIGTSGSVLGFVVLILSLPPLFRYQMIVVEACAYGREPGAFDAEFFNWTGSLWTLFPLPLLVGLGVLAGLAEPWLGDAGLLAFLVFASAWMPACIAVLTITHSPLQSLNPVAIWRLLRETGDSFWLASLYLLLLCWLALQAESLPRYAANFLQLFMLFSFSAVLGTLLEPYALMGNISIPDPLEFTETERGEQLESRRAAVLSHAYVFVSRGNRAGGFRHIIDSIEKEADVPAAWSWYFEHMLRWENQQHALFFAQEYIHDLLKYGENVTASKVIMRCRLIDEAFHPKKEDLPKAIEAAESTGNIELAAVLKRV